MGKHLPNDYAIDALTAETRRRERALGRPYSYGQLVAATTREEREQLAEDYRRSQRHSRPESRGRYMEADDLSDIEKASRKIQAGE